MFEVVEVRINDNVVSANDNVVRNQIPHKRLSES
jgi:hypothetical protein